MITRSLAMIVALLAFTGCSGATIKNHYYGSPDLPAALTAWQTRAIPTGCDLAVACTPESSRNAALAQAVAQVDAGYGVFRDAYFANRGAFDTAGDIVGLGLNAAGAAFGGAAIKGALAAVAGGVLGTRAIIDKDIFDQSTRLVVVQTMEANRAEALVAIEQGMLEPVAQYPLEVGMRDVQSYFEAGTVTNAMLAIATQSGTRSVASRAQVFRLTHPGAAREVAP